MPSRYCRCWRRHGLGSRQSYIGLQGRDYRGLYRWEVRWGGDSLTQVSTPALFNSSIPISGSGFSVLDSFVCVSFLSIFRNNKKGSHILQQSCIRLCVWSVQMSLKMTRSLHPFKYREWQSAHRPCLRHAWHVLHEARKSRHMFRVNAVLYDNNNDNIALCDNQLMYGSNADSGA